MRFPFIKIVLLLIYSLFLLTAATPPIFRRLHPLVDAVTSMAGNALMQVRIIPGMPLFHFSDEIPESLTQICIMAKGQSESNKIYEFYSTESLCTSKGFNFFIDPYEIMFYQIFSFADLYHFSHRKEQKSDSFERSLFSGVSEFFCQNPVANSPSDVSGQFENQNQRQTQLPSPSKFTPPTSVGLLWRAQHVELSTGKLNFRSKIWIDWNCQQHAFNHFIWGPSDSDPQIQNFLDNRPW